MLSRRTAVLSGVVVVSSGHVVVLSGHVVNLFGHAVTLSGFAASVVLSGHVVILSGRVVNLFGHVVVLSGYVVILSGYAPSERLNCGRTQKISTQALIFSHRVSHSLIVLYPCLRFARVFVYLKWTRRTTRARA